MIESADMLHVKGPGNGISGYSILQFSAETIGIAVSAQEQQGSFFKNGSTPTGVLTHPKVLKKEGRQALREEWTKVYAGSGNAGKTAILMEGMEYKAISINPKDAEILKTREFQVNEIARWFRMPPHKIQDLSRATFSNIDAQATEYVTDTLMAWLVRTEQEVNAKLLNNRPGVFSKFDVKELLRGDSVARTNLARAMLQGGALTPNEWREIEDLDHSDEDAADLLYMQTAMAPIRDIADGETDTSGGGNANTGRAAMSMAPIITQQVTRLNRKEYNALANGTPKLNEDGQALGKWGNKFYANHRSELYEAVGTAVRMAAPMADADLKRIICAHCDKQTRFLSEGIVPKAAGDELAESINELLKQENDTDANA
jgi:hypothetical protein